MHINFGAVYAQRRSRQATLGACAWHNKLQGNSQAGGGRERLCPYTNLIAFPFSLLFGGERDKTGLVYGFFLPLSCCLHRICCRSVSFTGGSRTTY